MTLGVWLEENNFIEFVEAKWKKIEVHGCGKFVLKENLKKIEREGEMVES